MKRLSLSLIGTSSLVFLLHTGNNILTADQVLKEVQVKGQALETPSDLLTQKIKFSQNQTSDFEGAFQRAVSLQGRSYGAPGKTSAVSVRGARPSNTLVTVDGLEVNSPVDMGVFDFSRLALEDFESMTVSPGPDFEGGQTAPVGGTLALTTKRGRGAPQATATAEGGSLRTARFHTSFSGEGGENATTDFYLGAAFKRTGVGRRYNSLHGTHVGDENFARSLTVNVGHALTDTWAARLLASLSRQDASLDGYTGGKPSFSHDRMRRRFDRLAPEVTWTPSKKWSHRWGLSYTRLDLNQRSLTMPYHTGFQSKGVSYGVTWYPQEALHFSAGYQGKFDRHKASQADAKTMTSHKVSLGVGVHPFKSWHLKAHAISHHHRLAGDHITQSVRLSWQAHERLALYVQEGQGLKLPETYEVYGGAWTKANPSLKPEKAWSYEGGLITNIPEIRGRARVSLFRTHITDFIDSQEVAPFVYQPLNGGKRRLEGLEATATFKPLNPLDVTTGYTYTRALPGPNSAFPVRIAHHKLHGSLTFRPSEKVQGFLEATFKSARHDSVSKVLVRLKPYTTVRAGVTYHVQDNCSVFGRVENVLDTRYEEVFGYGARGREVLIGVKLKT